MSQCPFCGSPAEDASSSCRECEKASQLFYRAGKALEDAVVRHSKSPFLCSACGRRATPVLRRFDGVYAPLSRCCSEHLVRIGNAPSPRDYLAQRQHQRTA